jgi:hypothetical protein
MREYLSFINIKYEHGCRTNKLTDLLEKIFNYEI